MLVSQLVLFLFGIMFIYFYGRNSPYWPKPPHYRGFTITLRQATLGRTPLDELMSPSKRPLYLIHNTHKRQTSMPPAGCEPVIPERERPQIHASDRAASGTGVWKYVN